ncbi:MAG TPA: hypothetical protein VFO29_05055 [Candidatus Rubrimentiphilum sp.]|nr:hypothetical protein [Candidatus Rubrimentiphilum sp.]
MTYTGPENQPEMGTVIGSAFADALGLMKKNLIPVGLFVGTAALGGLLFALKAANYNATQAGIAIFFALFYVVTYYSIAEAVRTVNPSYRMTVGAFFGFFGYQLLVGLFTFLAFLFLIIPGFWVGVKLAFAPYIYAITDGRSDALGDSWSITTGYYWYSLGFSILLGLALFVVIFVAELAAYVPQNNFAMLAIIAYPLGAALGAWSLYVQSLAYVRWTKVLMDLSGQFRGDEPTLAG